MYNLAECLNEKLPQEVHIECNGIRVNIYVFNGTIDNIGIVTASKTHS